MWSHYNGSIDIKIAFWCAYWKLCGLTSSLRIVVLLNKWKRTKRNNVSRLDSMVTKKWLIVFKRRCLFFGLGSYRCGHRLWHTGVCMTSELDMHFVFSWWVNLLLSIGFINCFDCDSIMVSWQVTDNDEDDDDDDDKLRLTCFLFYEENRIE